MSLKISFPEYYPLDIIEKDIAPFIENGIPVEFNINENRIFAALEWTIPTAIAAYIFKPYFESYLQELGKKHFEILNEKLKKFLERGKQLDIKLIPATKSTNKLSNSYTQSIAFSILYETKKGKLIKLLFDNDLSKEDWDNALDQMMNYFLEHYSTNQSKLDKLISKFDSDRAFNVYAIINKKTKKIEFFDDRKLLQLFKSNSH